MLNETLLTLAIVACALSVWLELVLAYVVYVDWRERC